MSVLNKNYLSQNPVKTPSVSDLVPRVTLQRESSGYRLEVEMPGVAKDQVEITVEDGLLTVVGKRDHSDARTLYSERKLGNFRRSFALDRSIDVGAIKAHMEQGLLTLHLQKTEALQPRKVTVS